MKCWTVTPFAGVWIEIAATTAIQNMVSSLPLRECGLKYKEVVLANDGDGHSLCGSVD